MDMDDESNTGPPFAKSAKPRARKSDGDAGSSKKRPRKTSSEASGGAGGGLEGLLDDDDDEDEDGAADRRAVENLIEAARGNCGRVPAPPKPEKNSTKRSTNY